jgi:hypothetical protein
MSWHKAETDKMQAYIVRFDAKRDALLTGKPVVGIYVAESIKQLADLCGNPEQGEYAALGPGGIWWEEHTYVPARQKETHGMQHTGRMFPWLIKAQLGWSNELAGYRWEDLIWCNFTEEEIPRKPKHWDDLTQKILRFPEQRKPS